MDSRKIVKKVVPEGLFNKIEPYGHLAEAVIAENRAGFPARGMNVIGVTGTSGKTTTTTLMANILKAAGYKTAYFTTVELDFGDGPEHNASRMTTLGATPLVKNLKKAHDNGAEWLVIEVASHALAQGRVWGVPFKGAIFTNLSHEHLDYHKTFEGYRAAKQKLFKMTAKNDGIAVVNADDANVEYFKIPKRVVSYGKEKSADVEAKDITSTPKGSEFTISSKKYGSFKVKTSLPGSFNVSNILAVSAMALSQGIEPKAIQEGIANVKAVAGRMASYQTDKGFGVIIDFAHTPDQFTKIFAEIRPLVKGKLIAVFGKPGRRDKKSRGIQGELAGEVCDTIILTEDDPRDEDNETIMEMIAVGARSKGKKDDIDLFKVPAREKAIQKAVDIAEKGDVILLLSKGHERTIEIAGKPKKWDELGALQAALKARSLKLK